MKRLLITAGPTREMLDPVRFISNLSTGEMGYVLASTARDLGYQVTLISGPTALVRPKGVKFIPIVSTQDLKQACEKQFLKHDVLIMTAAVCDFMAKRFHPQKIMRTKTNRFELKRTPDILAGLSRRKKGRVVIGFCLETRDWLKKAEEKLKRKRLDGIVANYYSPRHNPFGTGRVNMAFIAKGEKRARKLENQTKKQIAKKLLKWMEGLK